MDRRPIFVTRRELLRGAAAAGGGFLLGSGLSAGGGSRGWLSHLAEATAAESVVSGTLRVAWDQVQDNFDPQTARGNRNWWVLSELYETLTYLPGGSLEPKPLLAESWVAGQGGRTYTFTLRKGIKFITGTELTADAVKYCIDRIHTIKLGPLYMTAAFDRAQVVDRYTIRFHLKFPYAAWPVILSNPAVLGILDPAFVEAHGGIQERQRNAYVSDHTAGTAPWVVDSWEKGQKITLNRNSNYWRGWGARHVERVILETVPVEETRLLRLEKGDVDIATVSARRLPSLEEQIGNQHLAITIPKTQNGKPLLSLSTMWINMNNKLTPTNDINVRKALAHSFNYELYIGRVLNGYASRMAGMIPRGVQGHVDDFPLVDYNLDKAKAFLDAASPEAKNELSKGLTFKYAPAYVIYREGALLWQQDLGKIGIRLILEEIDQATLASIQTSAPGVPLVEARWFPDYPDPDNFINAAWPDYWPPTGYGSAFAGDAKTEDLIKRGRVEPDPVRRKAIYRDLELYFRDQYSTIMLAEISGAINPWNARATWVKGLEQNPMIHPLYYSAYVLK
jgi:peptide/nickel transport system substrate-binding protein